MRPRLVSPLLAAAVAAMLAACNTGRTTAVFPAQAVTPPPSANDPTPSAAGMRPARSARAATAPEEPAARREEPETARPMVTGRGVGAGFRF